jgi:hypothetical protein
VEIMKGGREITPMPAQSLPVSRPSSVIAVALRRRSARLPSFIEVSLVCRRITCSKCGKPGWRGCGAHVEQVLAHVPKDQRCKCDEEGASPGAPAKSGVLGWLRSLF